MPTSELQNQIAKLRRDKKLLWLSILFLVLVVLWILASIFATSRTSAIAPELRELAKPFVPRLESRVFEEILTKRVFDEGELGYFPIYILDKDNLAADVQIFDIMNFTSIEDEEDNARSSEASVATEVLPVDSPASEAADLQ